jgi:hypothetical protein
VWAVGRTTDKPTKAFVMHWDGRNWGGKTTLTSDVDKQSDAYFNDVFALSTDDVWAVGGVVRPVSEPDYLMAHWNGTDWKIISDLGLNVSIGELSALDGSASNDLWAVGHSRFALHWDGSKWSSFPTNALHEDYLGGIDELSPNNVWAAGGAAIVHWDGTSWTQTYQPDSSGTQGNLMQLSFKDIAMLSASDGWVIGTSDAMTDMAQTTTFLMHWDGESWSAPGGSEGEGLNPYNLCLSLATGSLGCGAGRLLALSENDVWAVGGYRVPIVSHWDGRAWENDACPTGTYMGLTGDGRFSVLLPGFGGPLHDVAQIEPGVLWGVGDTIDGNGYVINLRHGSCPTPVPTVLRPRPTLTSSPPTPLVPVATVTVPYPPETVPVPLPSGVIPNPLPSQGVPDTVVTMLPQP